MAVVTCVLDMARVVGPFVLVGVLLANLLTSRDADRKPVFYVLWALALLPLAYLVYAMAFGYFEIKEAVRETALGQFSPDMHGDNMGFIYGYIAAWKNMAAISFGFQALLVVIGILRICLRKTRDMLWQCLAFEGLVLSVAFILWQTVEMRDLLPTASCWRYAVAPLAICLLTFGQFISVQRNRVNKGIVASFAGFALAALLGICFTGIDSIEALLLLPGMALMAYTAWQNWLAKPDAKR